MIKTIKIIALCASCCFLLATPLNEYAVADNQAQSKVNSANFQEHYEPYGLLTTISISLYYTENDVIASAKNEFTFLPATVHTYVKLYSSERFTENIDEMMLESENYINDLNMGDFISCSAPKNGRKLYWKALVTYKMDNKDWVNKSTKTSYIA